MIFTIYIGVYDINNMCNGYLGQVIAHDNKHPTPVISDNFISLLVDIANIHKYSIV